MGGAFRAGGDLGVSHCVLGRRMLGPSADLQTYTVSTYHGRKNSPTVWTEIPVGGTVTIARLTRDLGQLLLTTGELVACEASDQRCRNTLVIATPSRDAVLSAVKGHQNHWVVACGDHLPGMSRAATDAGIEVVSL